MTLDSDIALLGTGIAPLVAANALLHQGKSVLILNPDWDFFLEDSELPLNPFLPGLPTPETLAVNTPEKALQELSPDFPGAIEFWSAQSEGRSEIRGFHDAEAPHVRQRSRLWVSTPDKDRSWNWPHLEDLYVGASDAGLNPRIFDGLLAARRFPGFAGPSDNLRGLYLPKLYDLDTNRYRYGVLEYIRERLNPEKRVICAVNELERMQEGIRFRSLGESFTAKLKLGMLVFWTPRLTPWILNHAKKTESKVTFPKGIRIWEQWLLNSRDSLEPGTVGMLGDLAVWADFEGSPPQKADRLSVLRASPPAPCDQTNFFSGNLNWASSESLGDLFSLCHGFLKWDRFSVRSMKTRTLFDWETRSPWLLSEIMPRIQVVPSSDGPILDIVRMVRTVCNELVDPDSA